MQEKLKEEFIDYLKERGGYFKKVHEGQYRMRCPFCGDTQKNLNEGHLYIKSHLNTTDPIAYNCFKCGESGYDIEKLLNALGCEEELKNRLIKGTKKNKRVRKNNSIIMDFNYKIPDFNIDSKKLRYIDSRFEIDFSKEDYENMKVIPSLYDFLVLNKISKTPFENYVLEILEKYYVGFMTSGNSHILFRDITDTQKISWIKYPISKESMQNRVFYTFRQEPIDIFTKEDITINLSEGIFDCIGVAYHFNYLSSNTMNISVAGKKYIPIINFLIQLGLVGNNIIINIFSDNDEQFNKNKKYNTTSYEYLSSCLKKYRPLFKELNIIHNMKNKDYGVPKEKIKIKKRSV